MRHQIITTWQHLRRSPYQAAAAVMIMTLTSLAGLVFLFLSIGSNHLLSFLEKRPQVIAFFNDTVTAENQVADAQQKLWATGKVASLKFISKDDALKIYRERNAKDPLLLELVTANILPASLEVSAKNVADLPQLYAILKDVPNVEDFSYQKDVVESLIVILDNLRRFGVGLIFFLIATALFTILTVIGMKIALRKAEIEVERLVGASGWYVRAPFLLEGFFYGAVGAIVAWGILYGLIFLITSRLYSYLAPLSLLPVPPLFMLAVLGGAVATGGVIGTIGSFLAVWRYLRF